MKKLAVLVLFAYSTVAFGAAQVIMVRSGYPGFEQRVPQAWAIVIDGIGGKIVANPRIWNY